MKNFKYDEDFLDAYLERLQGKIKLLIKLIELSKMLDDESIEEFSFNEN